MNNRKNNNLDQVLDNSGGRFLSLKYKTRADEGSMCARVVKKGSTYVTFRDMNTQTERKIKRSSIAQLSCGDSVYIS